MGNFIPEDKLANLKKYKYSSEDHSLISKYILKKWWNTFVLVFPQSMAPNLITLLGLGFILMNLAVVFYYNPTLDKQVPSWCYFFYAFGLFMYQTFDGCDGCHARRTGQSGPLGELFDHSIDAINTTLGSIIFASVLQFGYGKLLLLTQFSTICNFYLSTWEEYHTHTLYLSAFSGPVEGILMICGVFILTGIFGPQMFSYKLFDKDITIAGTTNHITVDLKTAYIVLGLISLYFNIALALKNVNHYYEKKFPKDGLKIKYESEQAVKGLAPFFLYYFSIGALVTYRPEILSANGIPLVLSIGSTMAFCVGRIILAHLTLQGFPYFNTAMLIPSVQLVISQVLIYGFDFNTSTVSFYVTWFGWVLTVMIHMGFVFEIIHEITTYLDIYALTIKHKKPKNQ
ncbi:uncharacterized protein KQ657_002750 [Scheffersomyces spartinae]|uniref:diacylglycerol cholinephosphotransferase n=1 Tax=Scheffersomyces spartinae TaxID=45513 RepID=A0A9P8AGT9_9ASCO|nr:uncharacterized protein KQ657_002750 [Scheffersomyces spartinae]KAG7191785.1 hypothetical protein KQ657_002750 [Scheffersomyces spartinae]